MDGKKKENSLLKAFLIVLTLAFLLYALSCLALRIGECFPKETIGLLEEILS